MSVTMQQMFDELNSRIGDTSEDRITNTQRYAYLTYGVTYFQERTLNDHAVNSFEFDYFDKVHYYKLTDVLPDLLEGNDMTQKILKNGTGQPFTRKSAQELRAEVGSSFTEDSYSIERRNQDSYLIVNHNSKYPELILSRCESLTDNGSWLVDTASSDATNLQIDTNVYSEGGSSFKFDIDVSQSGNNIATIYNSTLIEEDLTPEKDNASWLIDINIPNVTYVTSITYKWGSSTSNYYSVTKTADFNGNNFVGNEFMTIKFDWLGATVTGTPDDENINYVSISINYSSSQTDATSFYVDNIRLVRPEKLVFYYTSYAVGFDSNGNEILKFSALTDVPYFSGQYDQYKFPVADYAASKVFKDLRLYNEAKEMEADGERAVSRISKIIPKSLTRELKSFKVRGVNFRRGRGRSNGRGFNI